MFRELNKAAEPYGDSSLQLDQAVPHAPTLNDRMRSLGGPLVALASVLLGAIVLYPLLFMVRVPTTFRCRIRNGKCL